MNIKVPEYVKKIKPYPPGKPIDEVKREIGVEKVIKLASNENPLGPSPKALEAIVKGLSDLHRYPDGSCFYLRRRLSEKYGWPFDGIVIGNGSNEIIEMVLKAFASDGDEIVVPQPSFLMYNLAATALGLVARPIPLRDFRIDLSEMSRAVTEKTRVVFINNPNNPTGTVIRTGEWEAFLKSVPKDLLIVIDEAYIEFVKSRECISGVDYINMTGPWVVVVRTFSKAYGLAGLRVGYGVMHPDVAGFLNRVRQPFNVNSLAQVAALAALDDDDFLEKTRQLVWGQLEYLYREVEALGLSYLPTEANFFLIKLPVNSHQVYKRLLQRGIIARAMDSYGLEQYLRVSVGLEEENRLFIENLKEVLEDLEC